MGWRSCFTIMASIRSDRSQLHAHYNNRLHDVYSLSAGVDISFWGHKHIYERTWPVFDYKVRCIHWKGCMEITNNTALQVMNGSNDQPYVDPKGTVHVTTGSAVSTACGEAVAVCIACFMVGFCMNSTIIKQPYSHSSMSP